MEQRHDGRVAVDRSDTRWCSDGLEIGCDNGERVHIAFTLDCCDREAISYVATTGGLDSGEHPRPDDRECQAAFRVGEPPAGANRMAVRQRLALNRGKNRALAREIGLAPLTTLVQGPQSNDMAEAFVKTIERDYARVIPAPRRDNRTSSTVGSSITIRSVHTKRSATARRANSRRRWWKARPRTQSALWVDRMKAQRPRMRSGQARQPRVALSRVASGLTECSSGPTLGPRLGPLITGQLQ